MCIVVSKIVVKLVKYTCDELVSLSGSSGAMISGRPHSLTTVAPLCVGQDRVQRGEPAAINGASSPRLVLR